LVCSRGGDDDEAEVPDQQPIIIAVELHHVLSRLSPERSSAHDAIRPSAAAWGLPDSPVYMVPTMIVSRAGSHGWSKVFLA